ncbi:MAG: hypothetical protein NW223_01120 [Hyphomicrobiaceae bacterium]|nr:hypothetical protein [Hyphomicrobiaceae bacterium]
MSTRREHKLGDDQKAWIAIAVIDLAATLGVFALYLWFTAGTGA